MVVRRGREGDDRVEQEAGVCFYGEKDDDETACSCM